ncbi:MULTISPECIES: hypothetical protein [unclassified Paenibacillus]|uniref:RCC1 domain-containing protein n=1 Tax=unclassified Paenibacillus TaxID=185978 RepID=UPI001AE89B4E|nr:MULTISPECIES: hypothetical protein [unclassified Paenibacillus]MBP1156690.1 hypothetical protein [Paenibacillus sp. PvP091]MBP1172572.1 hypothetical protein [Paenibacillus sp. PvR098]MBP2438952.1 hypothetical protein [Paenibacillus sp. PvP052]
MLPPQVLFGAYYPPICPTVSAQNAHNDNTISTGLEHSIAIQDGQVWTWGYNDRFQLGDGTQEDRFFPVQVKGLTNIIAVAAGFDHTLALQSDGTVWAWGNNHAGQLGDGTQELRSTPVKVKKLDNVLSIAIVVGNHTVTWKKTLSDERPYLREELRNHLQLLNNNQTTEFTISEKDFEGTANGSIPYDAKLAVLYLNNEVLYDLEHVFKPYYQGTLGAEDLTNLEDYSNRNVPKYTKSEGFPQDAGTIAGNVFRYWDDPLAHIGESFVDLRRQVYQSFFNDIRANQIDPTLTVNRLISAEKAYLDFFSNTYTEDDIRNMVFIPSMGKN